MTAIIDNQVVSCLAEMERLQEKIKALNKEKQERAVTKEKKIRDTEPNMAVLKKWLENKEQTEHDKMSKKAKEDYEELRTQIQEDEIRRRNTDPYRGNPVTRAQRITFDREKEAQKEIKKKKILENYQKYHTLPHNGIYAPGQIKRPDQETFHAVNGYNTEPSHFMKDFIEATHNLFQIQQKRIDELEIKLQAQHHTPRQLEYMAHKRASRFKAHLAEKIHTGSPDTYQGCGGSCAICLEDMTSGEMCYKLNTGGMEHVFHRVCGEQQM